MTTPKAALKAALGAGAGQAALVGPRACAMAGEVEGLEPSAFLADPGKMARLLNEVQRGAQLDVVWAESGGDLAGSPSRLPIVAEAIRRLRTLLGERAIVGCALPGPLSAGRGADLLGLGRALLAAGCELLLLVEEAEGPADPGAYVKAMRPLAATARFHQALPALAYPAGAGDGWAQVRRQLGRQVLPVLREVAAEEWFGLAVDGAEVLSGRPAGTAARCTLLTTDRELTGEIGLDRLAALVEALRTGGAFEGGRR